MLAAAPALAALWLSAVTAAAGPQDLYVNDLFQEVMARMDMEPHRQHGPPTHVLRDQEYLQHGASLWGNQYMAGGAGEGYQFLKPEGSIHNIHEVKTDAHLPAYCNPPNPCPVGYTSNNKCMESMPNEAGFVREYQARQECMCDKEHMISCPGGDSTGTGDGDEQEMLTNAIQSILYPESVSEFDGKHIGLVAKKGDTWNLGHNPYLTGERLPTVAKKAPGIY